MNPYEATKAELFWMTPQERLQSRLSLSARRWAILAALAGTLEVAASARPGLLFLVVHGMMMTVSLASGAWLAARTSPRWVLAPWSRWAAQVLWDATALLAFAALGIAAAAQVLAWVGHPAPLGPLAELRTSALALLSAAGFALALAGAGAWALAWRWKLGRRD